MTADTSFQSSFQNLTTYALSALIWLLSSSVSHSSVWYVNDTSTVGDSYTTTTGADTNAGSGIGQPFRTIQRALGGAAVGDTILIDAGLYTETVVIDSANIILQGVDSRVTTVDPPGANTLVGLVGILVKNANGVTIKNLGVTGAYDGIQISNADSCTITSDSFGACGSDGVELKIGADFNTVSNNIIFNMSSYGVNIDTGANNTIKDNTIDSNFYGLLCASESNVIRGNTAKSNQNIGVYLNVPGAYGNLIESNTLTGNSTWGVYLAGPGNRVYGNIIRQNTSGGIYMSAMSNFVRFNFVAANTQVGMEVNNTSNMIEQNDILGNDTGVFLSTSSPGVILRRNNITNNTVNNVRNSYSTVQTADRNWFGLTDSVAIMAKIADANSDFDPWRLGKVDTQPGADTVSPKAPDTVGIIGAPSDTSIILEWSAVTANEEPAPGGVNLAGYHVYRSNKVDSSGWTMVGDFGSGKTRMQDTDIVPGKKYVYRVSSFDSTLPMNESFYSDSQPSDSAMFPTAKKWYVNDTYNAADSFTYAGGSDTDGNGTPNRPLRTIAKAMDFATAGDTVFVDAGTFLETVVITVDDLSLIGKDSTATVIDPPNGDGIFADTQGGLLIKNIGVTGAVNGVKFVSVSNSRIEGDSFWANTTTGILFTHNSDSNTLSRNYVTNNATGIEIQGDNTSNGPLAAQFNTIETNVVSNSTLYGISVIYNSVSNVVYGNTSSNNTWDGLLLHNFSRDNKIVNNKFESNRNGVNIINADAISNRIAHNLIRSNTQSGVRLSGPAVDSNAIVANDIQNNDTGVSILITCLGNTISKNNIYNNTAKNWHNPAADSQLLITRNWWGTTDENAVDAKFSDTVNRFRPIRLGTVDTAPGADTTAPDRPGAVTLDTSVQEQITVTWTIPTLNEETNGGTVGFSGVKIYRLKNKVDTTNWAASVHLVWTSGATDTTWTDTGIAGSDTFYYRLTAFDGASSVNHSHLSDTKFAFVSKRKEWFVNDAYTAADSYTYTGGSDTGGDGSPQKPYKSLAKVMQKVRAGDTIWLDAGTHGGDTWEMMSATETAAVNLDTDNLALIGVDSNVTVIDPPGAKTLSGLYGISATNRTGLLIKNLGLTGAYDGIYFNNVDLSTVTGDSACSNGGQGIHLYLGSDTNTVSGNTASSNSSSGIYLNTNANGNTVSGNTAGSNSSYGIGMASNSNGNTVSGNTANSNSSGVYLSSSNNNTLSNNTANSNSFGIQINSSSNNTVSGNTTTSNSSRGIWVYASTNNTVSSNATSSGSYGIHLEATSTGNRVSGNTSTSNTYGIRLETNCDTNIVINNLFKSNTLYGIQIFSSSNNTIVQNEVRNNTEYQVYISGSSSRDTTQKNIFVPSSSNPDSAVFNSSGNPFDFTRNYWNSTDSAAIDKKISDTASTKLIAFQPYRLGTVDTTAGADTTAPKSPDTVAISGSPSDTSIIVEWSAVTLNEEGVAGGAGLSAYRVYRSKTKDTSSWIKVAQTTGIRYQDTDVELGVAYYYRVTAFDTAPPFENESFFSDSQPFDSAQAQSRTNWYVNDAGTSGDSFTYLTGSNATGQGTPQKPLATITKAMQLATAGDTVWVDAGLYAETVVINNDSITLIGKDSNATVIDPPGSLGTNGLYGIFADTQVNLLIKDLGVTGAYNGIRFDNVDRSTITGDSVAQNGQYGVHLLNGSDTNTITKSTAAGNSTAGIGVVSSSGNTVSSILGDGNIGDGIDLTTATGNTISSCSLNSHGNYGIYLSSNSNNNTLTSLTANSNNRGIYLNTSSNNTVSGCTANSNTTVGISLASANSNTLNNNSLTSNANGIELSASSNNTITSNKSRSGSASGLLIDGSNNLVMNNTANSNTFYGINLSSGSGNSVVQNDALNNTQYQIYITNITSSDTITKNNIRPSSTNPDSGLFNKSGLSQNVTRNYWVVTDSSAIGKRMSDTSSPSLLRFDPYRFGQVDTTAGADTTAPKAPDSVAVIGAPSDTSVILEWAAVTASEEVNGGAVALSGYRVYRSKTKDTSSWVKVAQTMAIRYQDTDVELGVGYYYRVTAFDTATPFENESFFSDSQPVDSAQAQSRVNWYVNDASTTGDSFTSLAGSDVTGQGTASKPFATITKALKLATAGDTVWVDAGLYAETVVINNDSITLIGKDSGATVIDPPGANSTPGLYGIYASNRTGLAVKSLGVTGAEEGIYWSNVDLSTIASDSVCSNGDNGMYFTSNSDTNTVSNSTFGYNSFDGVYLNGSANNNTFTNNTFVSNTGNGIGIIGCSRNTISGNTSRSNSYGIHLSAATNSAVSANIVKSNTRGINLQTGANANVIVNNISSSNTQGGIHIDASDTNTVARNDFSGNADGVKLSSSAQNNTISKNNIVSNSSANVANLGGLVQTLTRNWFGMSDEVTIAAKISDTANDFRPYRLALVDTTAGADTTAPGKPLNVTLDTTTKGQIKISWTIPTLNEETNGGSVGFNGLNIWRLKDLVDTTNWANLVNLVKQTTSTDTTWTDTTVFGGNIYYYRMTSRDAATVVNEAFFTDTVAASPDTGVSVSLLGPAAGHETTATAILFTWTTANDAETYTWQLSRSSVFSSIVDSVTDTRVTSMIRTVTANDSYYWRVTGRDVAGNYDTTTGRGFVIDNTASQVTLASPVTGVETTVSAVSVSWNAASDSVGIDSYVLEVARDTSYGTTVFADTIDGAVTSGTITSVSNDTYFWRVRAIDDLGNVGANSASRGFVTDTFTAQAVAASPADGAETTAAYVAVSWTAVTDSTGIVNYVLEASRTTGFSTTVFVDTVVATKTNDTIPVSNDTYYWRVKAIDNRANAGAYSAVRGFVTDTFTAQVTAASPADGAETTAGYVAVSWSAVSDSTGIVNYVLEASRTTGFTSTVFVDTVAGTITNDTIPVSNDTYYWRVKAIDNRANAGAYSAVRGFVSDTQAGQVVLASPANGAETTAASVAVSWNAVADSVGIVNYVLEAARDTSFGTTVFVDTVPGSKTSDTIPVSNDTYYWRVKAIDNRSNVGAYSATRGFVSDTGAAQVVAASPADGTETTVAYVAVTWNAVTDSVGIANYVLEASRTTGFTTTVFVDTVAGTITNDTIPISNDTYYWRVRAKDNQGNFGPYSAVRGFVSDTFVAQVVAAGPVDGAETTAASVAVSWNAVSDSTGIVNYVLEASRTTGFSTTVFVDTVAGTKTNDTIPVSNDTYFWRVKAIDNRGNAGAYSAVRGFVTDTGVTQVVAASPADGTETTAAYVAVIWNAVTDSVGIANYILEASRSASFTTTVFVDTVAGTVTNDTIPVSNDTYYWRVRAKDNQGNFGPYSAVRGFVSDTFVTQVAATGPADGLETTAGTVTVTWNTVTDSVGIANYIVEVALTSSFATTAIVDTMSGTVASDAIAVSNDTYYWRVRAKDNRGNFGAYSAVRGFVSDTQAGTVTAVSPADGAETTAGTVTVSWSTVADSVGIANYIVEVSRTSAFATTVLVDTLAGTATTDAIPVANDTLYWRVRAKDNQGNFGGYSTARGFVSDTLTGQVALASPPDGAETTAAAVAVSWNALADSTGIANYVIEAARDTAFTIPVFTDTVAGSRTNDTITGVTNDTYYWRVKAIDNRGNAGVYSSTRGFVHDTLAGKVVLSSPASGSLTADTTPTVTWAAVADSVGIDSYIVEFTTSATFATTSQVDTVDGSKTSDTPLPGLNADTYYWRVKAIDHRGNVGAYSDSFQLKIDTGSVSANLVNPADGHETTSAQVRFEWTGVNADTYTWQLSRTTAFGTLIDSVNDTTATSVVRTLPDNDTYFWRVISRSATISGTDTSAPRGLVLDTRVAQVTATAPASGHETTVASVVVQWAALSDSVGIDSYILEVSTSPSFPTSASTDTLDVARTSDTITNLSNDTYYWRVRAIDDLGNIGPYSAAQGFIVDTAAGQVVLSSPASGSVATDSTPTLTWSVLADSVGIASYIVEVSLSAGFTSTSFAETVVGALTSSTVAPGLPADTYYWRVRAIDDLGNIGANSSSFVLAIDSATTLTVTAPNGGQVWVVGDTQTITWTSAGAIANVKIDYSTDSGGSFFNNVTLSTSNTGNYAWLIPDSISATARVRVSNASDSALSDSSDANFTIRGKFTITRPDGGETFAAFTSETIAWTTTGTIPAVRLEYSVDSGSAWVTIVGSTTNTGSYLWNVPNVSDTRMKIRVSSPTDTTTADTSNNIFTLLPFAYASPPDTIQISSGNHQLGGVSALCSLPLTVRVLDTGGSAGAQSARVTFTIIQDTGAHLGNSAGPLTTTAYTDASGYVSETLVLGPTAGVYRVEARNDSVAGKAVVFTAYADGRDVPAGGSVAGQGWRMVGPNKAVPSGWNLKSTTGGLTGARVFEWRPDQPNAAVGNGATKYYEPAAADPAVRGRAYWIKDATGGQVTVPATGIGSFDTVAVRLKTGWNQIAGGQYFFVSWDNGVRFDTSPVTDTTGLPENQRMAPSQAADTSLAIIQNKVYWYTGSNYVFGPSSETVVLATMQLKPMVGFWLYITKECTMYIYPNPVSPETYATDILNQAPAYDGGDRAGWPVEEGVAGLIPTLSAYYRDNGRTGSEQDWGIQLMASAGGVTDWQNYVGVKSSEAARQAGNALEAPGLASGYVTMAVREKAEEERDWMAAIYSAQITEGRTWEIAAASDLGPAVTLTWDNVENVPPQYDVYLVGAPGGPVNMRSASSLTFESEIQNPKSKMLLSLVIGLPEYVAPFLAPALSKEMTFVFPNPGPDATGNVTFKFNLNAAAEVSIKIFDVGGKLQRELKTGGVAGSNTLLWDATNLHGQRLGSGVYIYILESGGEKLVDKLAIVR